MKRKIDQKQNVLNFPQNESKWYFARRRLPIWLAEHEGSEKFHLPSMSIVMDIESRMILDTDMATKQSSAVEVVAWLINLMKRPFRMVKVQPFRPQEIQFEQKELAEEIRPLLQPYGITVIHRPAPGFVNSLMRDFIGRLSSDDIDQVPDLLKASKLSRRLVAKFFAAAADFYRAEPWIWLANEDVLNIQIGSPEDSRCVVVMGQGGESYGLSIFADWMETLDFFRAEDPMDTVSRKGRHVLFFDGPPDIPPLDYLAAKEYNWELLSDDAFPVPIIFRKSGVGRPDGDMLRWYEAVMRALPVFVEEYLTTHPDGSHPPVEAEIPVDTIDGKKLVIITYPAGDPTQLYDDSPMEDWDVEDIEEGEDDLPAGMNFDRRSTENDLAGIIGDLEDVVRIWDPKVYQAQQFIYDAWEEADPDKRIRLAKIALEISPDCADAFVLLAEEDVSTTQKALELYRAGVDAGKRALGEAFFNEEDNKGKFWGILETRPYMRALAGVASCLWALNKLDETEAIYRSMLALNHNDNQGVRYQLLSLLFDRGRFEDASRLMAEYEGDYSVDWIYCRIILDFRANRPTKVLRDDLRMALEVNPYVPEYLTGRKKVPGKEVYEYVLGSRDEAISYAQKYLNHWRKTEGAVAWLRENT